MPAPWSLTSRNGADPVAADPGGDVASSVLEGVADEVRRDPLEPAVIGLEDNLVAVHAHAVVPAARTHGCTNERPQVDALLANPRLACVEPRDLHQILDEVSEPGDVVDEKLGGSARVGRHPVELLAEERGLRDERGQRRAELVRDVGGEPALPRLGLGERADLRLQRLRHLVEGRRPDAELVAGLDRKPCLEEAFSQRVRRLARPADRRENTPREQGTDQRAEERDDPEGSEEHVPKLSELVPEALLRVEVVELGVGLLHLPADDEVARSRDSTRS